MGASYYKLNIENREVVGKRATKDLRRSGKYLVFYILKVRNLYLFLSKKDYCIKR